MNNLPCCQTVTDSDNASVVDSDNDRIVIMNKTGLSRKNKSCCVHGCINTSFKNPNLSFTRVPVISKGLQKTRNDSDRQRKLYAKSKTKRMTTLARLNATGKRNKLTLDYCGDHATINEKFSIYYRDQSNVKQSFEAIMKVPIDVRGSSIIRRSSSQIVKKGYNIRNRKRKSEERQSTNDYVSNKRKKVNKKCDVFGCCNHITDDDTYFMNIPPMPKPLDKNRSNLRNIDYLRYHCKRAYRRRILKTIGLHPDDNRTNIQICNHHSIRKIKVKTGWFNIHNKKKTTICNMN